MPLRIDNQIGYAKLDSFCFKISGDNPPQTLLDFGDGNTAMVDSRSVISHTYDTYGTFKACLRTCEENANEVLDCIVVAVKPYVTDSIKFEEYPEDGFASVDDGMNFKVYVTTNCPPPIRVKLSVDNTVSPPVEDLPETPFQHCLPRHYFTTDETFDFKEGVVILNNPSKVFVNGQLCGWRDSFCFGYYDDYPSEKSITAVLERTCEECFEIDWSVCDPVENCYINDEGYLPLIDDDIGI
jgi:hypothetical protein